MQAFDLNAVDYLLKPVRAARLAAALGKTRMLHPRRRRCSKPSSRKAQPSFSRHERGRLLLVPVADILYLKADLGCDGTHEGARIPAHDESLHLETEFAARFIRLHRSVLVAKDAITGFRAQHR